ncbi:hypothetical protein ACJIZ3_008405 [Penstemon smallii]|uniref:Uncharacterized protein n=1 Tax=Penstemon smallii TaxID=265156 RepID=A0ABD3T9Q3_9LAMI
MDDSWRMRAGMPTAPPPPPKFPNCPPRRSTEDATFYRRKHVISDFTDVFGGPPRTVLSRQSFSFTSGLPRSSSSSSFLYEEIFLQPEKTPPVVRRNGRSLPEFTIPGCHQRREEYAYNQRKNCFYNDIFGLDNDRPVMRSRSRSKTSSSSVLSSEELSPLRPAESGNGDCDVFSFTSKLRPINVKSTWNSTRTRNEDYYQREQTTPAFSIRSTENDYLESLKNYPFGANRRNASAETISFEPISNGSYRASADDDLENINSPSPSVSSVCHSNQEQRGHDIEAEIDDPNEEHGDEDDESMSSYVIEINSDYYKEGTCEPNGVDEAIAWVNEKFKWNAQECRKDKPTEEVLSARQLSEGQTETSGSMDEHDKWAAEEEIEQFESKVQTETQILDEKIRLWSNGKETDIRLLLSSLCHILWPNSGWISIPPKSITGRSEVKKAYQKARLCLHPDKLQQRGATLPQKYIAEKAFLVLQDAWATFNSQEDLSQ